MERIVKIIWGLPICLLITIIAGCRSVKYVPVESVRTDSVYVDRYLRDSIYQRDSVFVNKWTVGDTVYQDKVVYKYVYQDRVRYDTISIMRSDTVSVPYSVERELGKWEKIKQKIGGWTLIAFGIVFFLFIIWWIHFKYKS